MELVFATHNSEKVREMRALLADLRVAVMSAEEAGGHDDVVEDGKTFEENALKKARHVAERTRKWGVADDSGICIDALDGAPGVYTARWTGEGASDVTLVQHTLATMSGIPDGKRQANFESAIALVAPDGRHWIFTGSVGGSVAVEPRGTPRDKLPYDRIFIPDGHSRTFAEMPDEEKNALSHRGLAFQKLRLFLQEHIT